MLSVARAAAADEVQVFFGAAFKGDSAKIKSILEKNPHLVNVKGKITGDTALHWASIFGHSEVIELLIEKGAHIDEKDSEGRTPLNTAALHGRKEASRLLIKKGAGIDMKDVYGKSPLHLAAQREWGGIGPRWELLLSNVDIDKANEEYSALVKLLPG